MLQVRHVCATTPTRCLTPAGCRPSSEQFYYGVDGDTKAYVKFPLSGARNPPFPTAITGFELVLNYVEYLRTTWDYPQYPLFQWMLWERRENGGSSERQRPTEIVSPTRSQHPGLANQSCIPRRQCVPSPAALATVTETPRRSERKRPPALTIHIPSSTLSSFLTEASSSESGQSSPPLTPRTPPSPSVLRRRRFSKLRRQFGDAPPAAMVFGSEPGADESSKPNMRPCADVPATPSK